VAHRRDHGGVICLDRRYGEGLVQAVFHPEQAPVADRAADRTRGEWVVRVEGDVRARPDGTEYPAIPTGQIEVVARSLEVLSEADAPPFPIEERTAADELTRLRYRYLDPRRPDMTRVLRLRSHVNANPRQPLD